MMSGNGKTDRRPSLGIDDSAGRNVLRVRSPWNQLPGLPENPAERTASERQLVAPIASDRRRTMEYEWLVTVPTSRILDNQLISGSQTWLIRAPSIARARALATLLAFDETSERRRRGADIDLLKMTVEWVHPF
jgi:hypothetical protein